MICVDTLSGARLDAPLYNRQAFPQSRSQLQLSPAPPTSHATNQLTHTREPKGPPRLGYSNRNDSHCILCNHTMDAISLVTRTTLMAATTTTTSGTIATTTLTTTNYLPKHPSPSYGAYC